METLAAPDVDRWPFDLARVQLLHGEHLRRRRAVSRARVPLEAALETFEFLGARPWAARAGSELLATGPGREGSHDRLADLTTRELEVASMAATRLTNKQVGQRLGMSPRTVGAHLYRVYAKLAFGSRAALRDTLSEPAGEDEQPRNVWARAPGIVSLHSPLGSDAGTDGAYAVDGWPTVTHVAGLVHPPSDWWSCTAIAHADDVGSCR